MENIKELKKFSKSKEYKEFKDKYLNKAENLRNIVYEKYRD
jgi:hypothetical protein